MERGFFNIAAILKNALKNKHEQERLVEEKSQLWSPKKQSRGSDTSLHIKELGTLVHFAVVCNSIANYCRF
jgi:hypothetical protein